MKTLLIAIILLTGCGSDDDDSESSTPTEWSATFRDKNLQDCKAVVATQGASPSYASIFCECMVEAAEKAHPDEADFSKNAFTYKRELETNGTNARCNEAAI